MFNFLKIFKRGEKIKDVLTVDWLTRVYNILEDIEGDGVRIIKPVDNDGRGWRIVFDGKQSDTPQGAGREDTEFINLPIDVYREDNEKKVKEDAQAHNGENWGDLTPFVPAFKAYLDLYFPGLNSTKQAASGEWQDYLAITVQEVDGNDEIYKLAHGNQYAAWARAGVDGNSLTIAFRSEYGVKFPLVLRGWNMSTPVTVTVSDETALNGVAFMVLDEYIPANENSPQTYRELNPFQTRFVEASADWRATMTEITINEIHSAIVSALNLILSFNANYQKYIGSRNIIMPGRHDPGFILPHNIYYTQFVPGSFGHGNEWIDGNETDWLTRNDFEAIQQPVNGWADRVDDSLDVFKKFHEADSEIAGRITALQSKITALQSFMINSLQPLQADFAALQSNVAFRQADLTALDARAVSLQNRINAFTGN